MVKTTNQLDVPLIFLFYPVLFVVIAVHPVASDVGEVRAMGRLAAQRQADWLGTEPCGRVSAMAFVWQLWVWQCIHPRRVNSKMSTTLLYIYIHICIYIYMYIYIYVCVYVCMFACMHACIYTYIHTCMHACMYLYIHTYMHTYMHTYLPTYIDRYIHTRYIIIFYHLDYSFNLTVFTTIWRLDALGTGEFFGGPNLDPHPISLKFGGYKDLYHCSWYRFPRPVSTVVF